MQNAFLDDCCISRNYTVNYTVLFYFENLRNILVSKINFTNLIYYYNQSAVFVFITFSILDIDIVFKKQKIYCPKIFYSCCIQDAQVSTCSASLL